MADARSQHLTELLHALQDVDARTGSGASHEEMTVARRLGEEYYRELKRMCDEGHTIVIHTKVGLMKREEVRAMGRLDPENLVATYSSVRGAEICITPLNLVEGDTVEVAA